MEQFIFITMTEDEERDAYHLQLLEDAGLLKVQDEQRFYLNDKMPSEGGRSYSRSRILRVTNAGQDFAAAIRDNTIWNKTKAGARKIGGATLGILGDLAVGYLKQEAAEKLGLKL